MNCRCNSHCACYQPLVTEIVTEHLRDVELVFTQISQRPVWQQEILLDDAAELFETSLEVFRRSYFAWLQERGCNGGTPDG